MSAHRCQRAQSACRPVDNPVWFVSRRSPVTGPNRSMTSQEGCVFECLGKRFPEAGLRIANVREVPCLARETDVGCLCRGFWLMEFI